MRRTLSAAALLALMMPTMGRADDADAEKAITQLSRQAVDAFLKGDTRSLDAVLADDFLLINPFGEVADKAEQLRILKDGTLHFDQLETFDQKVRVYGDAAVLTDRRRAKATDRSRAASFSVRTTEVYAKRGGKWQCVSMQVTRIAETSPEKR